MKSWKEVYPGSSLKDIRVVFDNRNSSTVRFATDSICGGKPFSTTEVKALRTNQQVIDYVAQTPDAIVVIGVNWLGNRSDTTNLSFRNEIRVMAVSAEDVATPENSYKPYQAYCIMVIIHWHDPFMFYLMIPVMHCPGDLPLF